MKTLKFFSIAVAMVLFTACGNSAPSTPAEHPAHGEPGHQHEEGEAHEHEGHEGHEHEIFYSCEEHTGVHMHEPGKCPMCGKDLVEKEAENHGE